MMSSSIIQDLPFGEKKLKLLSGYEIKIPSVIHTSIPEQIVKQYQSYCTEMEFSSPLSHSILNTEYSKCALPPPESLCKG